MSLKSSEKIDTNLYELVIDVDGETFNNAINQAFQKQRKNITIPGFRDMGVKVYEYKRGFIHAKTFVSDDRFATIGSVNLDYRSLFHHFECGALLYDKPCIEDIKNDFSEMTENDCKEFTQESYKSFPLINRMIGRIFKVFAPLM